jgi:serine/threonine protein phosphatase PrpC
MQASRSPEEHAARPLPMMREIGVRILAAGNSNVGHERKRNEDAYLIATLQRAMHVHETNLPDDHEWVNGGTEGTLLVVADGMGGQGSGDVASRVAVQTTARYVLDVLPWFATRRDRASSPRESTTEVRRALSDALAIGDSTVRSAAAAPGFPSAEMGTTLTMAYLVWPVLYVAHVGDSRCYVHTRSGLTLLTEDHTVAQQLLDRGVGEFAPQMHHVLWNCLGAGDAARPDIVTAELEVGDTVILCTDGLTKHVPDPDIEDELRHTGDREPTAVSRRLIDLALSRGGSDNVTVVAARAVGVTGDRDDTLPM